MGTISSEVWLFEWFVQWYLSPPQALLHEFNTEKYLRGWLVLVAGGFIYATKMPERFFPGWFDYCGHSHNLMHVIVMVGTYIVFYANLDLFHSRQLYQCPA